MPAEIAANSSDNLIRLEIVGGTPTSVEVATQASHGTATASGTSITYTPYPGYSGTDSFTYKAINEIDTSEEATVTITVKAPPTLTLSPQTGKLSGGTVGSLWEATISVAGVNSDPIWTVSDGDLPDSIELLRGPESEARLKGIPATAGTYQFTIKATDSMNSAVVGSATYTVTFSDPAPVANDVPATVAANSSANPVKLNITGGKAKSVEVHSPASHGTATASDTSITYTPTPGYSGTDSFTYTAKNFSGTSDPATVTITVTAPTLALSPEAGALPEGRNGTVYNDIKFDASNGTAPYTYAVTDDVLPFGLKLTSDGILTGTPGSDGSFSFKITATDARGATGTVAYTMTILPRAALQLSPEAGTLAAGTVGTAYPSRTITASNGTAPYMYKVTTGALPTGLKLTTEGILSGTPSATGSFSFTITAADAKGAVGTATYEMTVNPLAPLTLSPEAGALAEGTINTVYPGQTIAASNGKAPYIYKISSGALPAGMTFSRGGTLSGTPTATGSFSFTVMVIDSNAASGTAAYTITVKAPGALALAPEAGALTEGTVGTAYPSRTITASNGTAPYTYKVTSGALPSGLTLAAGGTLSGTPTASGSFSFTVMATDANGATGTAAYSMAVKARAALALAPEAGALTEGTVGTAYPSRTITASNGTAPYTYKVTSGALPSGLTLATGGTLSGTPTASGSFSFTVMATDANGTTGTAAYSMTVKAPVTNFVFTPVSGSTLTEAMVGEDYRQPIGAKGGSGSLIYSLASGALPKGVVLNVSTGELTGP